MEYFTIYILLSWHNTLCVDKGLLSGNTKRKYTFCSKTSSIQELKFLAKCCFQSAAKSYTHKQQIPR